MNTSISRFIDLDIIATPDSAHGRELSFSKNDNPHLNAALEMGKRYQVIFNGKIRTMHYQRSPLTTMFLFGD